MITIICITSCITFNASEMCTEKIDKYARNKNVL